MDNIDLLPRADIPVLFNDFKTKADAVWSVVDSLVVTDVSQKEAMALARKTRLDLRNIRVAVEHKRVELGEGHLKEIQKVNGAAKAIREFIEPLEARLLVQESFAERVEADRIAALSKLRFDEVEAIKPRAVWVSDALAAMPQKEYDDLVSRLLLEKAQIETEKRLRIEAERKLAEAQAEAQRVAEVTRKTLELTQRVALEVKQKEAAARKEIEDRFAAEQQEAKEKCRREQAEKDRIRDEQLAKLEAELEKERAEKREKFLAECAERNRLHLLEISPDVEKLWDFRCRIQGAKLPPVTTREAQAVVEEVSHKFSEIDSILTCFCRP